MASHLLRLALLALLASLGPGLAAQKPGGEPTQERWQVPDHHHDLVRDVKSYWRATSTNRVDVTVSEDGSAFHPPTAEEEAYRVSENAPFSQPPNDWVEPGGTVGVIIVPLSIKFSLMAVLLVAIAVAVVAATVGYMVGRAKGS